METNTQTIEVNTILFESNDPEVLVKGTAHQGHMSYDTDILISQTQLNMLVNQLQRQNDNLNMSDLIQSEKMFNDETLFSATLPGEFNRRINITDISRIEPIKQIRA